MKERALSFRKNMTKEENRIWYYLRNRRLNGHKFVREYVIGEYIADFVCRAKKLIIEIDGSQHAEEKIAAYDLKRTAIFKEKGYQVIRFWNSEVRLNIQGVLEAILTKLETTAS